MLILKARAAALSGLTRTAAKSSSIDVVVAASTSGLKPPGGSWTDAAAQLLRAGEIDVAPGAGLGLEAKLRIDRRQRVARRGVVPRRRRPVVEQRRRPAQLAARDRLLAPAPSRRRRRPWPRHSSWRRARAAAD